LFVLPLYASLEKVSVQLEWKHQFQFSGFYAAKEKGYYEEADLDVEIKEFKNGINIVNDVLKNKSTFAISSSSIILNKLQNKPLVLIASYFKQNALVLATKPNINNIAKLKNKKIMLNSKHVESTSIGAMFRNNNLKKADYLRVDHNYKIDKFVNGEVDAISIYISNQPYFLDKLNVKYNILNPSTYGIYSFDGELFTSKKTAIDSTEMVDAFVKATNRGWKYAFKHKKEISELIYNKYSKEKTKDALLYEADKIEQLFNTNIFKIGAIVPVFTKLNAQTYINLGLVDKNIDITKSLSGYFLEDIKKQKQKEINFNNKEKEYLKQKKEITACINPNWMPFESFSNGKHIGLTHDYFKIFQEKTGIPIRVIKTKTWSESIESAKKRKCDIMSLVTKTEGRKEYLNFMTPYLKTPLVIATKPNVKAITDFSELKDKTVAIPKGYAFNKIIRKKYPDLVILDVENTRAGLQKVIDNEVFAYIGTMACVAYLFQKEFVGELKIAGKFDDSCELGLGIRNDDPLLFNIFEKFLSKISEVDKQSILNKWIVIKYEKNADPPYTWQIILIFILIISIIIYWNRRLTFLNIELENAKIKAEGETVTKSNFLANMSHEIRTPMNSIVTMSYLAKQKAVDKKQLQEIEAIEKASNSLLNILNNILDLSKIESNKLELNRADFNLINLIDNVYDIVKQRAIEKDLSLNVIYDKSTPINLYGDDFKITQILINLISNAIKFTESGCIELSVKKISDNKFKFIVSDSGIGIKKEQIDKIFLPFTQADSSITRKYGGSGLGLSIVKELIELMNGKIWIQSDGNKGSKFIFEIELQESTTTPKEQINAELKVNKIVLQKDKPAIKKILDYEQSQYLFVNLKEAITSRRPNRCNPIIVELEKYELNEDDKKLFIEIKKLLIQYKFNEAKELIVEK
jgi:signal transduction histidine kinase/ABC-type nitrate/sulfonate/bicarbonate transport system substrate-binding protein